MHIERTIAVIFSIISKILKGVLNHSMPCVKRNKDAFVSNFIHQ